MSTRILFIVYILLPMLAIAQTSEVSTKNDNKDLDRSLLSALNAQFIRNFLTQDVQSHDAIIHEDFVCIEGDGQIVPREKYIKNWATDFDNSGYIDFRYTDESIRIFDNVALVTSRTVYTKIVEGQKIEGQSVYTDTYFKDNGKWKCVQAQITPVRAPR